MCFKPNKYILTKLHWRSYFYKIIGFEFNNVGLYFLGREKKKIETLMTPTYLSAEEVRLMCCFKHPAVLHCFCVFLINVFRPTPPPLFFLSLATYWMKIWDPSLITLVWMPWLTKIMQVSNLNFIESFRNSPKL